MEIVCDITNAKGGIMKKLLIVLSFILVILLTGSISVSAETYGDFTYIVSADGTVMITDCDKTAISVEIPSEIEGRPVTVRAIAEPFGSAVGWNDETRTVTINS